MSENPYAGQGSVLLDIGGEVGALVVAMPASMVGVEIEIEPLAGRDHAHTHGDGHGHGHHHDHGRLHRAHVAVVTRPVADGSQPSLVFPDLVEGSYRLFDKGKDAVLLTAEVAGGRVTFADWPAA